MGRGEISDSTQRLVAGLYTADDPDTFIRQLSFDEMQSVALALDLPKQDNRAALAQSLFAFINEQEYLWGDNPLAETEVSLSSIRHFNEESDRRSFDGAKIETGRADAVARIQADFLLPKSKSHFLAPTVALQSLDATPHYYYGELIALLRKIYSQAIERNSKHKTLTINGEEHYVTDLLLFAQRPNSPRVTFYLSPQLLPWIADKLQIFPLMPPENRSHYQTFTEWRVKHHLEPNKQGMEALYRSILLLKSSDKTFHYEGKELRFADHISFLRLHSSELYIHSCASDALLEALNILPMISAEESQRTLPLDRFILRIPSGIVRNRNNITAAKEFFLSLVQEHPDLILSSPDILPPLTAKDAILPRRALSGKPTIYVDTRATHYFETLRKRKVSEAPSEMVLLSELARGLCGSTSRLTRYRAEAEAFLATLLRDNPQEIVIDTPDKRLTAAEAIEYLEGTTKIALYVHPEIKSWLRENFHESTRTHPGKPRAAETLRTTPRRDIPPAR